MVVVVVQMPDEGDVHHCDGGARRCRRHDVVAQAIAVAQPRESGTTVVGLYRRQQNAVALLRLTTIQLCVASSP